MSKNLYVGVVTQTPIYGPVTQEYPLNSENIGRFFQVQQGSAYGWDIADHAGGGLVLSANNLGANSSTGTVTLTAATALDNVAIALSYVTERSYDKVTVTAKGTTYASAVSGTGSASYTVGAMASGETIVLSYAKDGSVNASGESVTATLTCDSVVATGTGVTGYETKEAARAARALYVGVNNVARKVKKAYIGVNNVARLFFETAAAAKYAVSIVYSDAAKGTVGTAFSSGGTQMEEGALLSMRFYPAVNYVCITGLTATMGGESIDLSGYITKEDSVLDNPYCEHWLINNLPVTGDLVISVEGKRYYRMEAAVVNGTATVSGVSGLVVWRQTGGSAHMVFTPGSGYEFPDADLSLTGGGLYSDCIALSNSGGAVSKDAWRGRFTVGKNSATGAVSVTLNSISMDLTVTMTFAATAAGESSYTVSQESGASYGFAESGGWYESRNTGGDTSALARVNLSMAQAGTVRITAEVTGEEWMEVGFLSPLDTALSTGIGFDSNVAATLEAGMGETAQDYSVSAGEHFVVVKFINTSGASSAGMKFKVEIL